MVQKNNRYECSENGVEMDRKWTENGAKVDDKYLFKILKSTENTAKIDWKLNKIASKKDGNQSQTSRK